MPFPRPPSARIPARCSFARPARPLPGRLSAARPCARADVRAAGRRQKGEGERRAFVLAPRLPLCVCRSRGSPACAVAPRECRRLRTRTVCVP